MKYTAKIKSIDKEQHKKNAIFGVSLSGNGVLNPEQIRVCLNKLNNYKHVFIILHGNELQTDQWLKANEENLRKYSESKFTIISWGQFLSNKDYTDYYRDVFLKYYEVSYDQDHDFYNAIEETVSKFINRNPDRKTQKNQVLEFILEEMAFLMKFAIDAHDGKEPNVFVYPSTPLIAFEESKRVFLTDSKVSLMQWEEICVSVQKDCDEDIELSKLVSEFKTHGDALKIWLNKANTFLAILENYEMFEYKLSKDSKISMINMLQTLISELEGSFKIKYQENSFPLFFDKKNNGSDTNINNLQPKALIEQGLLMVNYCSK